jgi:hypothetical protein
MIKPNIKPEIDDEIFGAFDTLENFPKIFKNFLVKNCPEWHPRIFDTPLSLSFGLDR